MVNSEITLYFWNEVSETYILYVFLWESKIRFLFFLMKKKHYNAFGFIVCLKVINKILFNHRNNFEYFNYSKYSNCFFMECTIF